MIKSFQILLFILGIGLISTEHAFSTNYYFSQSLGSDSYSGRIANPNTGMTDGPKKSMSALNTLLNSVVKAGDSIFLRRGDIWSGPTGIETQNTHGTISQYILIGAYGIGPKPIIDKTQAGQVILCRGSATFESSYLIFQNLSLTSSISNGTRPDGVYINESFYNLKPHHIILDSLYITNCQSGMILYQHDIVVKNCTLFNNGNMNQGHGIFASANDILFQNNLLDSNGCGSYFVHTMYISNSNNVHFEGNEIKRADDGLKLRGSSNLIIKNNVIHDMHIHTIHVGGDNMNGTKNIIIDGNYIYNSPQGVTINSESGTQTLLSENIVIKNNIFPSHVYISNNGPVKDIHIYNNLIYNAELQNALLLLNPINPINIQIKNNIFYKTNANPNFSLIHIASSTGLSGITFDHNLYYTSTQNGTHFRIGNNNYNSLSTFKNAFPLQELHGQTGDPNFVNAPIDFKLTSSSKLAIDKGADVKGFVDFDIDGLTRPNDGDGINGTAWDIGPYEYCCPVVGFKRTEPDRDLSIFPNPANKNITIYHSNEIPNKIVLTDLSGKVIQIDYPTEVKSIINIQQFSFGIYFGQVVYSNRSEKFKFIKE
ncbi:MAG: right-handed parallel beta-helix repeat-containing protein [Saprospiraceae bacterium]|nr:right-handed parallel beta-helix repeat-containing protein [Candidatus Defluviibacterium haderslevense]